jgi:hypothetical protein
MCVHVLLHECHVYVVYVHVHSITNVWYTFILHTTVV